jgi:hypothetical protein
MKDRMRPFKSFSFFSFILVSLLAGGVQQATSIRAQDEDQRDIISEDFLKNRRATKRRKPPERSYTQASIDTDQSNKSRLKIGVTIWRLEPVATGVSPDQRSVVEVDRNLLEWIPKRVEANAPFSKGESLRLSIESPRGGYLYVVNRDWLADGSYGETNLIFPTKGDDNRLRVGKLIDIPRQGEMPFKATPKPNQSSELLTFIVTSLPLPLQLSKEPLAISKTQLSEWEEKWGAKADRYEMNGGAGQARTIEEQRAASPTDIRQLTREDPLPQTIYSLVPKNRNALLFNVVLSYGK